MEALDSLHWVKHQQELAPSAAFSGLTLPPHRQHTKSIEKSLETLIDIII